MPVVAPEGTAQDCERYDVHEWDLPLIAADFDTLKAENKLNECADE